MKDAFAVTVAMFYRVGIDTNLEKTKSIICMTGFIWGKWIEESYK